MQTIALIDGDIFCYEIAAGAEEAINWGDGFWTLHAFEDPAKARLLSRIEELSTSIGADRIIVFLSHKDNWRTTVLPTYKMNRSGARRPMLLQVLKDYLSEKFETIIRPGMEADDLLGMFSTWDYLPGRKVIITKDKDLQTIPGLHFLSHKPDLGVFEVSPELADRFHLKQALMGDITDGYSGCPGIGEGTADAFLNEPYITFSEERELKSGPRKGQLVTEWKKRPLEEGESVWDGIVSLYAKAGLGSEEALTQARVARICRASDFNFETKEVILWTP